MRTPNTRHRSKTLGQQTSISFCISNIENSSLRKTATRTDHDNVSLGSERVYKFFDQHARRAFYLANCFETTVD